jgi:hypothetical protein
MDYEKLEEILAFCCMYTHFSIVDCLAIGTFTEYYPLVHTLWILLLAFLAPLISFLLLYSLGHGTRLVIPWQVLHLA